MKSPFLDSDGHHQATKEQHIRILHTQTALDDATMAAGFVVTAGVASTQLPYFQITFQAAHTSPSSVAACPMMECRGVDDRPTSSERAVTGLSPSGQITQQEVVYPYIGARLEGSIAEVGFQTAE